MASITITIAIASCGRETLARTLASLGALDIPPGAKLDILVADDDPDGAAAKVAAAAGPHTHPLRVLDVGSRNISVARNACLAAAEGDMLAFVDDDEWVSPDWLERLLACKREFEADAVFGPVYPQYPETTPDWLVRANPLYVDWGRRGERVETGRSGNTLFDLRLVRLHGLRFDPALGKTGGEDTAFFAALHRAGGRLVVTDDAAIREQVPPHRLERSHISARALRSGGSWASIALGGAPGFATRVFFAADAAAKTAAGFAFAALLRPLDRASALRFAIKGWMNLGKLRESLACRAAADSP